MNSMDVVWAHPFALIGIILAITYAWSLLGNRYEPTQSWDVKRIVRACIPSAVVFLLVIAVSTGLKLNLPRVDFGMFYSSALLLQQEPQHLYDEQQQIEYLHAVTGLAGESHYLPYAYPPFVAFLFTPLTFLSFRSAYLAMLVGNIAVLIFTFWLLGTRLRYSQEQFVSLLIIASAAIPIYAVLILGHLTFIAILLLSLFATDMIGTKSTRAGLWTGFLLFKPILFPIPLLILLWKKQWNAILLFLGTGIVLLLLSYALVGWEGLKANAIMLHVMTSDYLLPKTQSLRGLAFAVGLGAWAWIILAGITTFVLWYGFLSAPDQRLVFAGSIFAVMLVPPYLQFHDLAIGMIAIALALATMKSISDRIRNYLFLMTLVPPALVLAVQRKHQILPIMPIFLSILFTYCIWKALQKNFNPDQS
jgi:hypothetical protein